LHKAQLLILFSLYSEKKTDIALPLTPHFQGNLANVRKEPSLVTNLQNITEILKTKQGYLSNPSCLRALLFSCSQNGVNYATV